MKMSAWRNGEMPAGNGGSAESGVMAQWPFSLANGSLSRLAASVSWLINQKIKWLSVIFIYWRGLWPEYVMAAGNGWPGISSGMASANPSRRAANYQHQ